MSRVTAEEAAARRASSKRAWDALRETGLKRRFIARKLGMSFGYLNQIQYGHARLTPSVKRRLADFLGQSEDELFPPEP